MGEEDWGECLRLGNLMRTLWSAQIFCTFIPRLPRSLQEAGSFSHWRQRPDELAPILNG